MVVNEFEKFCSESEHGTFTQSQAWARVKSNWEPEYITVCDSEGKVNGAMLVLVKKIPFLNTAMLYAPRGPVCDYHNKEVLAAVFTQIKLIAKKYHAYTIKIDPMIDENDFEAIENLKSLGFEYHGEKVGYDNIQCRENYLLDIKGKTADEIFAGFKAKHRYNIRLAKRKGVVCGFYGSEKLSDFEKLMEETSQRDGFEMRTAEYFKRVLDCFEGKAKLCMCYSGDTPLSGALMIEYAGTVSYVYGCSSNEHRNLMPNYLMQHTMIEYAVSRGCHTYDFCGIPYWYDETHHNYGVYKFKQGFGGYVKTYAGEFDLTFRKNIMHCADIAMKLRKML